MNYRCTIEDDEGKQIANIQFNTSSEDGMKIMDDVVAKQMMDEFLKIIAVNNFIQPKDCNTNLYKEVWINGI